MFDSDLLAGGLCFSSDLCHFMKEKESAEAAYHQYSCLFTHDRFFTRLSTDQVRAHDFQATRVSLIGVCIAHEEVKFYAIHVTIL